MLDAVEEPPPPEIVGGVQREVTAVPVQVGIVRDTLRLWAHGQKLPPDLIDDVVLAAYEAMANATSHAYPEQAPGTMTVSAARHSDTVTVTVSDNGQWRDGLGRPEGGRGLPLMRALADQVTITTAANGTTVFLVWSLPPVPDGICA